MNHREAWDLIPWLVNGSLDAAQSALLEQHLGECTDCRAELQAQHELMRTLNAGPQVEAMPRASLQRLWARIDAGPLQPRAAGPAIVPARKIAPRWLLAGAAGIVLALGATLALLTAWRGEPADEYRTVSDAAATPAAGGIRVVFAGSLTVAELHTLLQDAGLRSVSGPTPGGVYTLAPIAAGDARAALETLRAHPGVRFAEPAGD